MPEFERPGNSTRSSHKVTSPNERRSLVAISPTPAPVEADRAPAIGAAIYARVSSSGQLGRDGDSDGYSIPAQVEACSREAQQRGATVVKVYIERAESARSDDRPVLQEMLRELPTLGAKLLIVHKVDRLARNRLDDAQLYERMMGMGVTLVLSQREHRRHAGRTPHARHVGDVRRVLLQQPRDRDQEGAAPEAQDRRHAVQAAYRVPAGAALDRGAGDPHRRGRSRACPAGAAGLRPLRDRRLEPGATDQAPGRPGTPQPSHAQARAGTARRDERPQAAQERLLHRHRAVHGPALPRPP